MPKIKNNFFGKNNKSRSSAFKKVLFYQNIICFDWVMNLFLSWVMLLSKKCHFSLNSCAAIHFPFKWYKNSKILQLPDYNNMLIKVSFNEELPTPLNEHFRKLNHQNINMWPVHGCSNHLNLEMDAECLTKNLPY